MKTLVTVVASAILGFTAVFTCVPRRAPEQLPPTWFELPGRPLRVDGCATSTWAEVNQVLRESTMRYGRTNEFVNGLATPQPESEGPGVRIEYVPWDRNSEGVGSADGVATVTVRPVFPRAVPWSRANQDDLFRYEVDRQVGVN